MKQPDPLASPGSEIGGYRIEHELGAGGMGTVYAAVEPTIGKRVAVKILRAEIAGETNAALRFEREARSVSAVHHPAIVDVFAFGKLSDGRPYFVMPLYEGRTLREEIARRERIPPDEAWRVAREIAEGLSAAHRAGVLHRDLKPDNVYLSQVAGRKAQPVLLDFGLAKWVEGAEDVTDDDRVKLTGTGVPLGTPIYMAPEQWWSSPSSPATDQYAFGIVLFEMLTGRPPFQSQRYPELLHQHLHETPPTLASVGVEVSNDTEALVAKLLSKEADDRYPSFAEVIEAGDQAFQNTAVTEPRPGVEPPSSAERAAVSDAIGTLRTEIAPGSVARVTSPTLASDPRPFGGATLGAYAASAIVALVALVGVGYAGADRWDIAAWMRNSGFGGPVTVLLAAIASVLLPRLNARRASRPAFVALSQLVAVFPLALSLVATLGGWKLVTDGVDTVTDRTQAFEILHQGRYEIGSCDFIGFGLVSALMLGLVALLGTPVPISLGAWARTPWALVAAGVVAAASAMLASGLPSAFFTLVVAAVALLWLARAVASPTPLARELGVAALCATVAARAVSQVRADVHAASAWVEPTTRAERVDAMIDAARDRSATTLATTVALLLVTGAAAQAFLRARESRVLESAGAARRGAFAALQLMVTVALFGVSLYVDRAFEERRASIVASLKEQLTLFAALSPPTIDDASLPAPVESPALQITPDAVALNGKGIGKLSALDAASGRQAISTPIVAALATPRPDAKRSVDLSLIVDRAVPWSRVEELLALSYEGGARSVDLLLTRGAEPAIPRGAPPEVANLLPRDFGAVEITLGDTGFESDASTFADVTEKFLQTRAQSQRPIPVRVRTGR
ncbi:MAG: serine/threonine protein kinase [Polyangiaceae bacterium]|nr:serine/threonine protein kinase [Polyangiaceae bacterium]